MSSSKKQYVEAREALLTRITSALENDPRFVAAWLAGSFGRGEQTWLSDVDLHVVVAEEHSENLCATPWPWGARTTPERLALFQQFGTPTILYEVHANNQIGGTFTHVVYQESAQNVDWMLIPQSKAHQEYPSLVLFDKVGIPEPPRKEPLSCEQSAEVASTAVGFFWMIASSNVKNLIAGDLTQFHQLLTWLKRSIREVKAALQFKEAPYLHIDQELYFTQAECIVALRQLCDEMEELMPEVIALGGYVPSEPCVIVEKRLALLLEQDS